LPAPRDRRRFVRLLRKPRTGRQSEAKASSVTRWPPPSCGRWKRVHDRPHRQSGTLVLRFINTVTYCSDRLSVVQIPSFWRRRVPICREIVHFASSSRLASAASSKRVRVDIRHRIAMLSAPRSCSSPPAVCAMTRSRRVSIRHAKSSANGGTASSTTASRGSRRSHAAGGQPAFPPQRRRRDQTHGV
jgi:hypothetical protein